MNYDLDLLAKPTNVLATITPERYRQRTIAHHLAVADLYQRHPNLHPDPPDYDGFTGTIAHLHAKSAAHLRFLLDEMDTVELNERMNTSEFGHGKLWLDCTVDGLKISVTGEWEKLDPPQPPEQTIAERRAALVASLVTPALAAEAES